jgi:hypothetical protein
MSYLVVIWNLVHVKYSVVRGSPNWVSHAAGYSCAIESFQRKMSQIGCSESGKFALFHRLTVRR